MKQLGFLFAIALPLTGCIGTELTGREVDTNLAYPDLHSVPDRPALKDFKKIDEEREDFESDYENKLDRNDEIRNKYHAPNKKSDR